MRRLKYMSIQCQGNFLTLAQVMYIVNQTDTANFFFLVNSLLQGDLIFNNLLIFIAAGVVSCGGRKSLPVHHHNSDYIFCFF